MRAAFWAILALMSGACRNDIVRLRLPVGVRMAPVEGVVWSEAAWELDAIRLRGPEARVVDPGWSALSPSQRAVGEVPDPIPWTLGFTQPLSLDSRSFREAHEGAYVAIDILARGELILLGTGPNGVPLSLHLALPDFETVTPSSTPFGLAPKTRLAPFVLIELGGQAWSEALLQGVETATGGVWEPSEAEQSALSEALADDVHAVIDQNSDGKVQDDERARPLLKLEASGR